MSYLPGARYLSSSRTLNIDSGWQRSLNPQGKRFSHWVIRLHSRQLRGTAVYRPWPWVGWISLRSIDRSGGPFLLGNKWRKFVRCSIERSGMKTTPMHPSESQVLDRPRWSFLFFVACLVWIWRACWEWSGASVSCEWINILVTDLLVHINCFSSGQTEDICTGSGKMRICRITTIGPALLSPWGR